MHLVEAVLLVGLNGDIGGRVGNAGQHESLGHLGIIKVGLARLINGAGSHHAGA